ncbi:hypothetical protein RRG08_000246 [Elysia crispata]|uniref:Uncharacterized protein n=1 Tax=Elysia crispata TaxID=231223 RepID=A0AAE0Y950_9GAST|nr:hypothetical protein RRG08_000246 [Elysia crispata]
MLDEKRYWTRKDDGREKILDEKRCWSRKDIGREKMLDEKRCWTRKDIGREKMLDEKRSAMQCRSSIQPCYLRSKGNRWGTIRGTPSHMVQIARL